MHKNFLAGLVNILKIVQFPKGCGIFTAKHFNADIVVNRIRMPEQINPATVSPKADINLCRPLADADKVDAIMPAAPAQIRKTVFRVFLRDSARKTQIQLVNRKR